MKDLDRRTKERVAWGIRQAAGLVADRFTEETRFGVDVCVRCEAGRPRRFVVFLVLRMPVVLGAQPAPRGSILWHVEGPTMNSAIVRFRRRLEEVKRPAQPRRKEP